MPSFKKIYKGELLVFFFINGDLSRLIVDFTKNITRKASICSMGPNLSPVLNSTIMVASLNWSLRSIGRFAQLELRSIGVALNWSCAQLVASLNWSLRSIMK
jgi:hypothetical protein